MSRRVVETNQWDDAWLYGLSPVAKLCYFYIRDNCDNAGVWDANYTLAESAIGFHRMNPPLIVDWEAVYDELNTPPKVPDRLVLRKEEEKDKSPLQVMIVEGNKWWLVKYIVFHHGYRLTDDPNPHSRTGNYHKPIFKSLRKHKLLESFKALYPNVEIVSSGYQLPEGAQPKPVIEIPTIEEIKAVRDEKHKELSDENINLFFSTYNADGWKVRDKAPVGGWKALIQKWYDKHQLTAKERQTAPARPETQTEKKERIRLINEEIAGLQKQTVKKGLVSILPVEIKAKIAELRKQIESIETDIKKGN